MWVNGMQVEPAATFIGKSGHHHLNIDGNFVEEGSVVPKDSTHIHFGNWQTSDSTI